MNKHLLVISKNYWGANTSELTGLKLIDKFTDVIGIQMENVMSLIGNDVNVVSVKNVLYNSVYKAMSINNITRPVIYIYINGHGNQVNDINGDENTSILQGETIRDNLDEIYQLPDGNIVDDEITDIIDKAVIDSGCKYRLLVVLISDHCSSGSMIDNKPVNYDWITIGSSLDYQDSYITGDGNVMTCNMLGIFDKYNREISSYTAEYFYKLLDEEMKGSFIGDIQSCTFHVSSESMFLECLFK
jgi:hypothetical protein